MPIYVAKAEYFIQPERVWMEFDIMTFYRQNFISDFAMSDCAAM